MCVALLTGVSVRTRGAVNQTESLAHSRAPPQAKHTPAHSDEMTGPLRVGGNNGVCHQRQQQLHVSRQPEPAASGLIPIISDQSNYCVTSKHAETGA